MKFSIAKLLIVFFFNQASAFDNFTNLYSFSEDVRSVILRSPGGNPFEDQLFNLNEVQADQMLAISSLDNLTKEHVELSKNLPECDQNKNEANEIKLEEKISKRNFEVYFLAKVTDKKYEQNMLGRFTTNDYNNYLNRLFFEGNFNAGYINNLVALESKYLEKFPLDSLMKYSLKEKVEKLNSFANKYLGVKIPDGLLMKEMAFNQLVNQPNSWKETLNEVKGSLTNQQKIELVSKIGGFFNSRYNYNRFNEGDKAKGFITTEQLFNSIKNGNEGGVCRDIALAQTQLLRELGFKDNYSVTYKSLSGHHTDVITRDPISGKIVKFNYSETIEMKKNTGTEALIQDSTISDHGIKYRIADADGKPVTQVTSELGLMLSEAAGGKSINFNNSDYKLARVGIKVGDVDGNLFNGKTSNGESLYGIAVSKNYKSKFLNLSGGLAVAKLSGDKTFVKIDQNNLFARVAAELKSPEISSGPVKISGFGGVNDEILAYKASETSLSSNLKKNSGFEIDNKAEGYVGMKTELNVGKTTITNKTYATYYPDLANVANQDKSTAVRDSIIIQTSVEHELTDKKAIIIDSVIALKNYGKILRINGAYEDKSNRINANVGLEVPISKDIPSFLPGASKKVNLSIEKQIERSLVFTLEFDRDLDKKSSSIKFKASQRF